MGKSKYETHVKPYFDDIFYWYSREWTLKKIAAELGVGRDTFLNYKKDHSDLFDLLKKAEKSRTKYFARKAELALADKLEDREIEETHTEIWKDDRGKTTKQHVKKVKKIIPADTTAIIFALKNVDPDKWSDRQKIEHSGSIDIAGAAKEIESFFDGSDSP